MGSICGPIPGAENVLYPLVWVDAVQAKYTCFTITLDPDAYPTVDFLVKRYTAQRPASYCGDNLEYLV